jgi:hypothetical protein
MTVEKAPAQMQPTQPEPSKPRALEHVHPEGNIYWFTCKACRAADRERSALDKRALNDAEVALTAFLIPESDYDSQVCRAYLEHKYPDAEFIASSIDLSKLTGWADDEQLVIVTRQAGKDSPGMRRKKDEEGKWETMPVLPSEYIAEVTESSPINVKRTINVGKADKFTKSAVNIQPLMVRLMERVFPPYRIDLPKHEKDTILRIVHG